MFITGLVLLVLTIVNLTKVHQTRHTMAFDIRFAQAQGIQEEAAVRVAGVMVGRITQIQLDGSAAKISVRVKDDIKIYHDYSYTIGMGALVGERFIEIHQGALPPDKLVTDGDLVDGTTTPDMDDLIVSTKTVIGKLNTTVDAINTIVGDDESRANLKMAVANLRRTTESSVVFVGSLNDLVVRNRDSINGVVKDLQTVSSDVRKMSSSLMPQLANTSAVRNIDLATENAVRISDRLQSITAAVDTLVNDKELSTSLKESTRHLKQACVDLEMMMAETRDALAVFPQVTTNLQQATADLPQITKPVKDATPETVENVRQLSQRLRAAGDQIGDVANQVSKVSTKMGNLKLEPDITGAALFGRGHNSRGDLNLDIKGPTTMVRLGAADVGNSSVANLQFGNRLGAHGWLRYGIVQSRLGGGLDYYLTPDTRFSGELFDPDRLRANALVDFRLRPLGHDWWLSTGFYNLLVGERQFGIGLTYRP